MMKMFFMAPALVLLFTAQCFAAGGNLNPNAEELMVKVIKLQKADKYEEANRLLDKAMVLYPNYQRIFAFAGYKFVMVGLPDKGLKAINRAIELDPGDAGVRCERGSIYWNKDRKLDAIEEYSKAIELDPKFILAYHHRASTYKELGNLKAAQKDLQMEDKLGGLEFPSPGCQPWITSLESKYK